MELFVCEQASFGYDGKAVVEDLNFSIQEHEYLCIIGENGAGKSTLVKGLLGLLPPMSGKVSYQNGLKANEIGYLPQQSTLQDEFPASVMEVTLSGCLNQKKHHFRYTRKEKKMAMVQLKRMDMLKLRKKSYKECSGGQKQRVLLARALCASDKVLLLDEPTKGLDPVATKMFYDRIEDIYENMQMTIIMVSHDVQVALKYATKILYVQQNHMFYGSKEQFMNSAIGKMYMEEVL